MIVSTKKLQQKLFMLPVSTAEEAFTAGCHITSFPDPPNVFVPHSSAPTRGSLHLLNPLLFNMDHAGQHNMILTLCHDKLTMPCKPVPRGMRYNGNNTRRTTPSGKYTFRLEHAWVGTMEPSDKIVIPSWTRMLPTQPPLDEVHYDVNLEIEDDFSEDILRGRRSLGDIVRELLKLVHGTMGSRDWIGIDLAGSTKTMRAFKRSMEVPMDYGA